LQKNTKTNKSGGGAVKKILHKVAALKMILSKPSVECEKVYALTGIQGESTIKNALSKLKKERRLFLLLVKEPKTIYITEEGMEAVDPIMVMAEAAANIPTTNDAFHDSIKVQYKLNAKAILLLFDHIKDRRSYRRQDVAEEATIGMTT
jgi:hypothetical protein